MDVFTAIESRRAIKNFDASHRMTDEEIVYHWYPMRKNAHFCAVVSICIP